jgi:hypothetical protein
MARYQCIFFAGGQIGDWENIECATSSELPSLLRDRLQRREWDYVEAWLDDALVWVVRSNRGTVNSPIDADHHASTTLATRSY